MDNLYDQTAAYAARNLDAAGFLDWLLAPASVGARLRQWLDTRHIAYPGEPDRRCDTVAGLEHPEGDEPPEALVIEFKDRARGSTALQQLAEYGLRVYREVPVEPGLSDRYQVGSVLVNLTGVQSPTVLVLKAPSVGGGSLTFRPVIRDLETRSARTVLRGIARERYSRCILAWIPLMHGSGEAAIIEQWKHLAAAEPDERKRSDYAALALIFAELAKRSAIWRPALEGWNMQQSAIISEWIQQGIEKGVEQGRQKGLEEGRQEGRQEVLAEVAATLRAKLLHYLERRFGVSMPESLRRRIDSQSSFQKLDHWFDLALDAASLEQFAGSLEQLTNGPA